MSDLPICIACGRVAYDSEYCIDCEHQRTLEDAVWWAFTNTIALNGTEARQLLALAMHRCRGRLNPHQVLALIKQRMGVTDEGKSPR